MNKISFGAKKFDTVNVLKLTNKGYLPYKADLVRFNISKKRDWNKLETLKNRWNCVLMDMLLERCMDLEFALARKSVFFITEPQKYRLKDHFEPEKVLGASLFIQYPFRDYNYLAILQKNPEYVSCHNNGTYKHVGQEFLNFFKHHYGKKDILVKPVTDATGFYIKNGFIPLDDKEESEYIWQA